MKVIGLTGGIASGKTTVADMLAARGAVLIDTDVLAREVVEPGEPAYTEIAQAWPEAVGPDGTLDRLKLGAIIFGDATARERLNAMTHPRIRERMVEKLMALAASDAPPAAAVLVIPLLFENGLDAMVEESWLVGVEPAEQKRRLMRRNGFSEAEADARIAAQMPFEEKKRRATRVVDNSGDLVALEKEVERVWREAGL